MAWLTANWFWVAFIAMDLFGHGGHAGHGGGDRQPSRDKREKDEALFVHANEPILHSLDGS